VAANKVSIVAFPDKTSVYVMTAMSEDDKTYLAKAFWDQRWERWLGHVWPWLVGLTVPPIILFALGAALIWVGRGFRSA
jgi:hypothetical protein